MQRTVVHANFHWKLVQRYELFLKDARILEEKSSYLRYFRPFLSLFSFYLVLLQMHCGVNRTSNGVNAALQDIVG